MTVLPSALQKGDTIAIVAPARPVESSDLPVIAQALEKYGYKVVFADNISMRRGYLAGEDDLRAKAFMDAWCMPEVKMIWCAGGGYGSTRILELLDFDKLRRFPKIFVGMSDITALHSAINKELDLVTFLGPMPIKLFVKSGDSAALSFSLEHLWQMLSGSKSLPLPPPHYYPKPRTVCPGKASGRLVGGNLALTVSLIGTRWQIDTKDKILILEDIHEEPYRIDRMLRQLKQAGLLESPAGVVLASWIQCGTNPSPKSLTLDQIFDDYFLGSSYPVFIGYPSGHIDGQLTLPLNCLVELDTSKKLLTAIEDHVENNYYGYLTK